MNPDRAVCVHGHFYQPPRENPWTDRVDPEPSAHPWPDWNQRITDECYAPNTAAAVHGPDGVTRRNNFASMSFDVGPTLLTWLAGARPDVHDAIVGADAGGIRGGGCGGAIAHPFDHLILPLADPRDRRVQVRWGLDDFRYRFGRDAAGMWLPETAVDLQTLEALAREGVRFTILAPHQAARVRPVGGEWRDLTAGGEPVTGRPYRQRLPSGRAITLLFYDGALSHDIAFGGLLHDGEELGRRLEAAAHAPPAEGPRLALVATDGESYGHHHAHGEMALARALERVATGEARLSSCEAWLARHPPEHEVEIAAPTSWSCAHGVRRWAGGCDCGVGADADHAWRRPLRRALDHLRADLARRFDEQAEAVLREPREALAASLPVWRSGSGEADPDWWRDRLRPGADRNVARRLLDMERHAMRMFTSCGWFFDDPAGLETRQVLRYAGRALELSGALGGPDAIDADPGGALARSGDPVVARVLAELSDVRSRKRDGWTAADELARILREDRPGRDVSRPVG